MLIWNWLRIFAILKLILVKKGKTIELEKFEFTDLEDLDGRIMFFKMESINLGE